MEYVIAVIWVIGAFIIAICGNLIASEIYDWVPSIARWLIKRAVDRLPNSERDRYREEWLSHLNECPGKLTKLFHAIGCLWGASFLNSQIKAPAETRNKIKIASIVTLSVLTLGTIMHRSIIIRITNNHDITYDSGSSYEITKIATSASNYTDSLAGKGGRDQYQWDNYISTSWDNFQQR